MLLGVDRLDYTKGIEVRLRAYRALLEAGRIDPATTVFVQIRRQPSRDEAPGYAETRTLVEQMAGSINGDFGSLAAATVKYVHQGQDLDELVALVPCRRHALLLSPRSAERDEPGRQGVRGRVVPISTGC